MYTSKKLIVVLSGIAVLVFFMINLKRTERSYHVKIVVPDQFRGLLKIHFLENAPPTRIVNGVQVFNIPQDGILRTSSENPFALMGSHHAKYSTGGKLISKNLYYAKNLELKDDEIAFREIGCTNDFKEYWAIVEAKEIWLEESDKFSYYLTHYNPNN